MLKNVYENGIELEIIYFTFKNVFEHKNFITAIAFRIYRKYIYYIIIILDKLLSVVQK